MSTMLMPCVCVGRPLAQLAGERGEIADVVPAEGGRHHGDPSRRCERLGEGMVDRDRGQGGPVPCQHLVILLGAGGRGDLPHAPGEAGDLHSELVEQHPGTHDEHPGVPEEGPGRDEPLGRVQIRLLHEPRDGEGAERTTCRRIRAGSCRMLFCRGLLDIAEAGRR